MTKKRFGFDWLFVGMAMGMATIVIWFALVATLVISAIAWLWNHM